MERRTNLPLVVFVYAPFVRANRLFLVIYGNLFRSDLNPLTRKKKLTKSQRKSMKMSLRNWNWRVDRPKAKLLNRKLIFQLIRRAVALSA